MHLFKKTKPHTQIHLKTEDSILLSLISLSFLLLNSKPESAGKNSSICNSSGSLSPVTQPCPQLSFPSSFLLSALVSPLNFAFLDVMIN